MKIPLPKCLELETLLGCEDCEANVRLATQRLSDHAERGKGITLTKEETKIIAQMLEDL